MKLLSLLMFLVTSLSAIAQRNPDFQQIFRELKEKNTTSESMAIRIKYLKKMNNLQDFNQLASLEILNEGEIYFNNYLKSISDFVVKNVSSFINNVNSDEDQDIYTYEILPKAYDQKSKTKLLQLGLAYVHGCEDFYRYAEAGQAEMDFIEKYSSFYCKKNSNHSNLSYGLFELITNTILNDGEYKTIYLPRYMFVSKLYISASGSSGNAYFDVMVNGDIKGTIYVPGRDPLYIVNIASATNSIELRSLGGSAFINSIKAQY